MESLAIQTLVLFVIRTAGHPWQSRPSLALATTTLLIVLMGSSIPFTPLAGCWALCRCQGRIFCSSQGRP